METITPPDRTITPTARRAIAEKWQVDQSELQVVEVSGGYSLNRRGLVSVKGEWIFAKEVDLSLLSEDGAEELAWLKKDYEVMRYLEAQGVRIVPKWSELLEDGRLLLLPSYRVEDRWQWDVPQTEAEQSRYVNAVIAALKEIDAISPSPEAIQELGLQPYFRDKMVEDDGFVLLRENEAIHNQVMAKLRAMIENPSTEKMKRSLEALVELFQNPKRLAEVAEDGRRLADQPNDRFGHCDARSDNLAYNRSTGEVKFVDWNWASMTPSKFGTNEFLVDMARRGLEVGPWSAELNRQLLAACIGFYAQRCIKDPLMPGSTLREMQAESAAVAYELYRFSEASH